MITTFKQAQEYLESHIRLDVFTRFDADKHLSDPLERMRYLLKLLDDPHTKYKSIQVTGTSGKGSTSYFLSHFLTTAGYKTGFTLSPHLQTPQERMQINNRPISQEAFITLLNDIIPAIEQMTHEPIGKPSYFEILLGMALLYFAQQKVDIVVAEVGLEGKYDGTNALSPVAVVLTNISLDHTAILGSTIEEIAKEAVSAIHEQTPPQVVVSGILHPSVLEIVQEKCQRASVPLIQYHHDFSSEIQTVTQKKTEFSYTSSTGRMYSSLELSLKGRYQVDNASLALETIILLQSQGIRITEKQVQKALQTAFFPGRFEEFTIQGKKVILDGAHNEAKMDAFIAALQEYYPEKQKYIVLGFKKDKDVITMLKRLIPHARRLYLTEFQKTTDQGKQFSMTVEEIHQTVASFDVPQDIISTVSSSQSAVWKALQEVEENGIIVVTGSLYLVGEVRAFLTEQNQFQS